MEKVQRRGISVSMVSNFSISSIFSSWQFSRPNWKGKTVSDWNSVVRMDVPVNEFSTLIFQVSAPIAIREVICSLRNHVIWARSSRVDDLDSWSIWDGCSEVEFMNAELLKRKMDDAKASNHQDDFRQNLPMSYMTNFSWQVTLRDLVKFLLTLKNFKKPLFDDFIVTVCDASPQLVLDLFDSEAYAPMKLLEEPKTYSSGVVGDFVVISVLIPLALRAQLVRHRALQFKDDLWTVFAEDKLSTSISEKIHSQISMPVDFAEELIRKRNCWIAQTDLWEPLLQKLRHTLGHFEKTPKLPCEGGVCRFKPDNDLRKEDKDPAPPCPVAAMLSNEKMSGPHQVAADAYASRRPFKDFWIEEIKNVSV